MSAATQAALVDPKAPHNAPAVTMDDVAPATAAGLAKVVIPLTFTPGEVAERELATGAWRRCVVKDALDNDMYRLTDGDVVHALLLRRARSAFNVGDWVELQSEGEWVSTVVTQVLDDDMYMVDADDFAVPSSRLRAHVFAVGDDVEVKTEGGMWVAAVANARARLTANRWVAAVVSRINPTCVLGRDDPVKHVRPAPFGEGDHVEEKVRGSTRSTARALTPSTRVLRGRVGRRRRVEARRGCRGAAERHV